MKLSKTEAHILSTLEQANGEIVARETLNTTDKSNSLEVLISRLRKKLHQAQSWHQIQTVRGEGYRLVANA